jgi:hypothetical protein
MPVHLFAIKKHIIPGNKPVVSGRQPGDGCRAVRLIHQGDVAFETWFSFVPYAAVSLEPFIRHRLFVLLYSDELNLAFRLNSNTSHL